MTDRTSDAPQRALIEMLERQQTLVHQLGDLAEQQKTLIEKGDSDALLALLAQRQQIMDQFIASQDELSRLSAECREAAATVDEPSRKRIGTLVEEISGRLSGIMQRDEADRGRLESSRERVGEELAGLSAARAARDAYVKGKAVNNRFADRQG